MTDERRWIANPELLIRKAGERLHVHLPFAGRTLRASTALASILAFFESPRSLAEAESRGFGRDVIAYLVTNDVLMPPELANTLGRGILVPASTAIGVSTTLSEVRSDGCAAPRTAVFGAPFDSSPYGHILSSRTGPGSIRRTWMKRKRTDKGVRDLGDVVHYPHAEPVSVAGDRIRHVWSVLHRRGIVPFMLGGDHSLSFYTISAAIESVGPMAVVQLDAHPDLAVVAASRGAVLTHANVFSRLLEEADLRILCQVGVRRPDRGGSTHVGDQRVKQARCSIQHVLKVLPDDLPIYISIDLDVLDGGASLDVTTPERGGASTQSVLMVIDAVLAERTVVGVDCMEVCGVPDSVADTPAAETSCRLIEMVAASSVPSHGAVA